MKEDPSLLPAGRDNHAIKFRPLHAVEKRRLVMLIDDPCGNQKTSQTDVEPGSD